MVDSEPRELITQAEYARRRGVSREAVSKARRQGRLARALVDGLIDPAVADAEWRETTLARAGGRPPGGRQEPRHSPAYAAVLAYLEGTADRLAPLLARESSPARMRSHLRTLMRAIAEELERVGLV
jgi:hypothetical protein